MDQVVEVEPDAVHGPHVDVEDVDELRCQQLAKVLAVVLDAVGADCILQLQDLHVNTTSLRQGASVSQERPGICSEQHGKMPEKR